MNQKSEKNGKKKKYECKLKFSYWRKEDERKLEEDRKKGIEKGKKDKAEKKLIEKINEKDNTRDQINHTKGEARELFNKALTFLRIHFNYYLTGSWMLPEGFCFSKKDDNSKDNPEKKYKITGPQNEKDAFRIDFENWNEEEAPHILFELIEFLKCTRFVHEIPYWYCENIKQEILSNLDSSGDDGKSEDTDKLNDLLKKEFIGSELNKIIDKIRTKENKIESNDLLKVEMLYNLGIIGNISNEIENDKIQSDEKNGENKKLLRTKIDLAEGKDELLKKDSPSLLKELEFQNFFGFLDGLVIYRRENEKLIDDETVTQDINNMNQVDFLKFFDFCIDFLRKVFWKKIFCNESGVLEGFSGMSYYESDLFNGNLKLRFFGPHLPKIHFDLTSLFKSSERRNKDISYWYYKNIHIHYNLKLGAAFQNKLRKYVESLYQVTSQDIEKRTSERENSDNIVQLTEWKEALIGKGFELSEEFPPFDEFWKKTNEDTCFTIMEEKRLLNLTDQENDDLFILGLTELTYQMGMLHFGNSFLGEEEPKTVITVFDIPDPNVLSSKLFGLKTSIPGFDDLVGGGLILNPPAEGESKPGLLGVIRGQFAGGKSTFATQLALEMVRKGGAGVLLVLEQSIHEVMAQIQHFGWSKGECKLFTVVKIKEDEPDYRGIIKNKMVDSLKASKGFLCIYRLSDYSLDMFQDTLQDLADMFDDIYKDLLKKGHFKDKEFNPRFIVVDPIDAVHLIRKKEAEDPYLLRNKTQEELEIVTKEKGIMLWLTTSVVEDDPRKSPYYFLPNIGDVVVNLSLTPSESNISTREEINVPPMRLFEFEKVRTQRFAKGVHPFEINSRKGIHIYPAGDAITKFVTWFNRENKIEEIEAPVSLGHESLNLALGTKGVRRCSVTTLMGPTGCAKTELALLYLLGNWKERKMKNERSLFVGFRDTWESVEEILKGPVGTQLDCRTKEEAQEIMTLLELDVGSNTSAWIFQKIKDEFKRLRLPKRYTRVVVDNVAYMDLTAPRVRNDELFVPNLLTLIRREGLTPLFITSLIEGPGVKESRLQAQIRDASHNLFALKRNSIESHHFIAMQIKKSQKLVHYSQPFQLAVKENVPPFSGDAASKHIINFIFCAQHLIFLEKLEKLIEKPDELNNTSRSSEDNNYQDCEQDKEYPGWMDEYFMLMKDFFCPKDYASCKNVKTLIEQKLKPLKSDKELNKWSKETLKEVIKKCNEKWGFVTYVLNTEIVKKG